MDQTPAPDAAPDGDAPGPAWNPPDANQHDPGPGSMPGPAPTGMDGFFASIRRTGLVRTDERWIGGVSGGIAQRLGIDPLIVRGLFGVGALLGGVGLVLYGVGWLLMPEQRDGRIHLQQLFRGDFDAAVIGGFALLLFGFAYPGQWYFPGANDGSRWFGGVVGVVAIAVIIALVVSSRGKGRPTGPVTHLRPGGPGYPATAPVPPAPPYRSEGFTMYPASPAPGQPLGPTPNDGSTSGPGYRPGYGPGYGPTYPGYPGAGQTYPGAGQTYGPQPGPAPWPPARPYRPTPPGGPTTSLPRARAEGPGGRAVGIVVALSLLLVAGLKLAEREDVFDGPVMLTVAACVVIMCGIGIAIAGAMGRRSGGLGAVAIITILVVAPASAATDLRFDGTTVFVGDGVYTPVTRMAAEDGYDFAFGDVTVDLTEVPEGSTVTVPLHLGAGDLEVIVPEGAAVIAEVQVGVGDITWLDGSKVSGVGNDQRTFETAAVQDGAAPDLELDINVGAGTVRVVERS